MEELLKEILAELKKLNSGIIISADDMRMLLDREKEVSNQRSRSIFSTIRVDGNAEIDNDSDNRIKDIYKEAFGLYESQKAIDKNGDEIDAIIAAIRGKKEKAQPLENRVAELEKTVKDFKAGIAPVLRGYKDCEAMPCTSAKSK